MRNRLPEEQGALYSVVSDLCLNKKSTTKGLRIQAKKGAAVMFQVADATGTKPAPFTWPAWHAICSPGKKRAMIAEKQKEASHDIRQKWRRKLNKMLSKKRRNHDL